MRARWDPLYPPGRRGAPAADAALRASDDERNAVADALARHYADGRLDEVEFRSRLDTAMAATTRGDLDGLFADLPHLGGERAAPPPRSRRGRFVALAVLVAVLAVSAGLAVPFTPLAHVPWLVVALVAVVAWRHGGRHRRLGGDEPRGSGPVLGR